ncbi:MAG TPA: reverse transcriptase-like protein [Candidatus Saccharimonadales bacterium]|nr:reverse transcriptase-like protein [Candidatus Saccharimonadales bacterium]
MKTIKLDHHLAELVRKGEKTATWRIYDDKNLSVNDEIEFVDKVEKDDPSSWNIFANAVIDTIIEKRLGAITEEDYVGHERFVSRDEMIQAYRKYYGPEVNENTPVKIIHFTLISHSDVHKTTYPANNAVLKDAKLYADGGSRGNPGPSASGYVLYDMNDTVVVKKGIYLGVTTNNQAEYQALKFGLEEAVKRNVVNLHVYMDSMLVVNQMNGIFQVKNRDLWPIHDAIKQLAKSLKHVTFTHVPRALNKAADAAVNEVLDEHTATHKAQ